MIPKIAFSYWEGDEFTYLHSLTIKTFAFYNPEFKIIIYTPTINSSHRISWNSGEHENIIKKTSELSELSKINNVSIIKIDIENDLKLADQLTPVHRSDYVRVKKLYEHGGFWIDFDIFFIKSIQDTWLHSDKLNIIKYNIHENLPIGFIWAPPGNNIVLTILNNIETILRTNSTLNEYQFIGASLWTKMLNLHNNYDTYNETIIYPYLPHNLIHLFYRNCNAIKDDTIGIHWYNGDKCTRLFLSDINNNKINSTINKLINKFLLLETNKIRPMNI